ncbi:helix-turn-helix transcriptional regulator [Adlercreutzia muris]|uniref:Helix-turn-helix transcriptional regulator n=2 Tax=Adlercreutzia muris TaxID=1796610 RepID=A0A7C8BRT0_9ACTN|nr:helix-turn-helix transcriptional regulator [Adlercreutzia muris]
MRMGGVGSLGWGLARGDASLSVLVPVAEVAPARECPTGDDGAEAPVAGSGLLGKAPAGEPMRDGGCSRGAGDDPVAALADAYGLTETEAAIVRLIAQGRSRSYIAQALSYSENTIRNYTRTVYRKAAVHSKQELLDKLE